MSGIMIKALRRALKRIKRFVAVDVAKHRTGFGAYSLELFSGALSTNRSKLTLQQGDKVNVLFASGGRAWV